MTADPVSHADVVIVAAVPLERDELLEVTDGLVPGTRWMDEVDPRTGSRLWRAVFETDGRDGHLHVVVVHPGAMAEKATAAAAEALVERCRPRCVAMCGVLAGFQDDTALGDVIVGTELWTYDEGKEIVDADGGTVLLGDGRVLPLAFEWAERAKEMVIPSSSPWLADRPIELERQESWFLGEIAAGRQPADAADRKDRCPRWTKVVENLRDRRWIDDVAAGFSLTDDGRRGVRRFENDHPDGLPAPKPPKIHAAPIATGGKLVRNKSVWAQVRSRVRATLGIEMEAAAIGWVAHRHGKEGVRSFVAKAVMDFGDEKKADDFKKFAARASAEVLVAFLRRNLDPCGPRPGIDDDLGHGTDPLPTRPPDGYAPSQLLRAQSVAVPFDDGGTARRVFAAELEGWLRSEAPVAVRLAHAPAGAGKTRLGIEIVRRLRGKGWYAGFLRPNVGREWLDRVVSVAAGRRVLAIVDYGETQVDLKDTVIGPVVSYGKAAGPRVPIRILLFARNAGEWWGSITGDGSLAAALAGAVRALPPLADVAPDRHGVFEAARKRFAELQERPVPTTSVDLDDIRFETVLYIHMAAVASVEGIAFKPAELLDEILRHEGNTWIDRAIKDPARDPENTRARSHGQAIVAAVSLLGGVDRENPARALAGRVVVGVAPGLVARLHDIYARQGQWLGPLEPDLLAERCVAVVLESAPDAVDEYLTRVFERATDEGFRTGFTVLARVAEGDDRAKRALGLLRNDELLAKRALGLLLDDELPRRAPLALVAAKAVGARTAFSPLGDLLAERLAAHGTQEDARVLRDHVGIPSETVSLKRLALWAVETIRTAKRRTEPCAGDLGQTLEAAERHRAMGAPEKALEIARQAVAEAEAGRAHALGTLSNALSEMGKREAALTAAAEAATIFNRLTEGNVVEFLPHLARSLCTLANKLSEMGRRVEALFAAAEGEALFRRLYAATPAVFRRHLAGSLSTLASRQLEAGRREDALVTATEAVTIYRHLASENSDEFLSCLAKGLAVQANAQRATGRRKEALLTTDEATTLYRHLSVTNRDAFLPDLALGLNNLAIMQADVGKPEEALVSADEATTHYRQLAERNADAFLPGLAMSLNNLAKLQSDIGKRDEALVLAAKAVARCRQLAGRNADAFLPDLAKSLSNLAVMLSNVGNREEALATAIEAVTLRRQLESRNSGAFLPDLAASLNNLAGMQNDAGEREEGLASAAAAAACFRQLVATDPDVFLPELATTLGTSGSIHLAASDPAPALAVFSEALDLVWPLYERLPAAHAPVVAVLLREIARTHEMQRTPFTPQFQERLQRFAFLSGFSAR